MMPRQSYITESEICGRKEDDGEKFEQANDNATQGAGKGVQISTNHLVLLCITTDKPENYFFNSIGNCGMLRQILQTVYSLQCTVAISQSEQIENVTLNHLQDKNAITPTERNRIVSLLLALNKQFGFHPESFALGSKILDRFLYLVKAQKKYLPCIAIACFFLAAKLTEEEEDLPGATELLDASGYSFSVSDLLRMERVILSKLDWNLNSVTPLSFLQAFHALTGVNGCISPYAASHHLHLLTYKMELLICQHTFLSYRPSTLALALLIQDLNSSLGQWIDLIQSFQAEIKVPEWELNACCVAVSRFLDLTLYYDGPQKDSDVRMGNSLNYENNFSITQPNYLDGGTSNLISALALETKCAFESGEKITTSHSKLTRMLSTVA